MSSLGSSVGSTMSRFEEFELAYPLSLNLTRPDSSDVEVPIRSGELYLVYLVLVKVTDLRGH